MYSSQQQINQFRRQNQQYVNDSVDLSTLNDEEESHPDEQYEDKYKDEKLAINDAQSVRYTAYTMDTKSIVTELRNVGVTVLSLESLSTTAMIHYMDAVTSMRLGEADDEKCVLYTDRMGRVFNVVISGGTEGLAKAWSSIEASYSGWIAISFLPFLVRVIASYGSDNDQMALSPLLLLLIFGFVLHNETSKAWLSISIFVRGTNSVGSHVWRSGGLMTDYPRLALFITLALASTASSSLIANALTIAGAIIGCLILLCSLGSRAWQKADLGFIDADNLITPILAIFASLAAGICFPFMALNSVHSGTDGDDGNTDVEKVLFHKSGKRARQHVTFASFFTALIYLFSDIQAVQDALGFQFSTHRGVVNFSFGIWIFLSTIMSMALCHRLDSSTSKKIEPFLHRDETSPVGWIVPSIPHIVIDPSLSRGKMIFPCLSYGSDVISTILVGVAAFLILWSGVKEMHGNPGSAFWEF